MFQIFLSSSENLEWLISKKSWRQHSTKKQLYGHLPLIMKTIQVRWTRHAGHCWRSRDKLIRDVLLWTPSHVRAKSERLARTYIQQLCKDTGCSPEDQSEVMNDWEEWRERVRDIHAGGTTRWWWWWWGFWCLYSKDLFGWMTSLLILEFVSVDVPEQLIFRKDLWSV